MRKLFFVSLEWFCLFVPIVYVLHSLVYSFFAIHTHTHTHIFSCPSEKKKKNTGKDVAILSCRVIVEFSFNFSIIQHILQDLKIMCKSLMNSN